MLLRMQPPNTLKNKGASNTLFEHRLNFYEHVLHFSLFTTSFLYSNFLALGINADSTDSFWEVGFDSNTWYFGLLIHISLCTWLHYHRNYGRRLLKRHFRYPPDWWQHDCVEVSGALQPCANYCWCRVEQLLSSLYAHQYLMQADQRLQACVQLNLDYGNNRIISPSCKFLLLHRSLCSCRHTPYATTYHDRDNLEVMSNSMHFCLAALHDYVPVCCLLNFLNLIRLPRVYHQSHPDEHLCANVSW